MPDPSSDRDPIEALATEFVERIRRGERPEVEQYATRYPDLAKAIKGLFPTIARMEQLKSHKEQSSGAALSAAGPRPENLGDFRILREVGRGGMGIVYEAEQKSLGRRVAVKVLPQSSLLSPRQLQRFHREAQTAAGLHHTNIVPVFGVGEEDGYHYIVMQIITGVGLDEILVQLAESQPGKSAKPDGVDTGSWSNPTERIAEATDDAEALAGNDIEAIPGRPVRRETADRDAAAAGNPLLSEASTADSAAREAPTVSVGSDSLGGREAPTTRISDLLRHGPAFWRNVAHVGAQVADALGYAHGRGVLHRDIKPSNLLVDRRGIVWVTDFGLAKAMEDDSMSRTGDIVGTLRYMAPERFRGNADARSDIYSLGLTLYETLALRPAYEGSDASNLMRKITQEPPARLAAVVPGVPRDLETIVMKTIAREPAHRYQTAGELAEDLRLFLEDRPIHARRVSPAERLWRWCRRNRVVAGLAATSLALLLLVAVVASVGYIRTSIANTKANEALAGEFRQRQKAEATSQLAMEALDDIFKQFAPERISEVTEVSLDDSSGTTIQVPVQPVLSKEAASLLEHLLVFYDRLAAQGGDDADLRRKVADANRRIGDIRERLGQFEQSQAAYLRAIDGYRQIEEETPGDISVVAEIARVYNNLGQLQAAAGSPEAARSFHVQALDALERPTKASDVPPLLRYEMARTCYMLGRSATPGMGPGAPPPPVGPKAGPPPGSEELPPGGHRPPPRRMGRPPGGPGHPPGDDPRRDEDVQYLRRAIGLLEDLVQEQPTIPDYQRLLACCYRDLPPERTSGPGGGQSEGTVQAIDILENLTERFPGVPLYQQDLARTYLHAFSHLPAGTPTTAENWLRKALRITERLIAEHPNVPEYTFSQVQVHLVLSEVYRRNRRDDAAEPELRKALGLLSSLVSRFPDVGTFKTWQAVIQESLGKLLSDQGQTEEARSLLKASIATLRELREAGQEGPHIERTLMQSYSNLAEVYWELGQEDLAEEALRQAEQYAPDRRHPPGPPRD